MSPSARGCSASDVPTWCTSRPATPPRGATRCCTCSTRPSAGPTAGIAAGHVDRAADAALDAGRISPDDPRHARRDRAPRRPRHGVGEHRARPLRGRSSLDVVHVGRPTLRHRALAARAGCSPGSRRAASRRPTSLCTTSRCSAPSRAGRATSARPAPTRSPTSRRRTWRPTAPVDDVASMAGAQFARRPVAGFVYEGDRETEPTQQDRVLRAASPRGRTADVRRPSGRARVEAVAARRCPRCSAGPRDTWRRRDHDRPPAARRGRRGGRRGRRCSAALGAHPVGPVARASARGARARAPRAPSARSPRWPERSCCSPCCPAWRAAGAARPGGRWPCSTRSR